MRELPVNSNNYDGQKVDPGQPQGHKSDRTVVICTALEVEYVAVREFVTGPLSTHHDRGTIYEKGSFSALGSTWTVVLVETGAGNSIAGVALERAITRFSPDAVLFVGVAGGRKDVTLGDVVAADAVYDYDAGKDTDTGYLPRIKTHTSAHALVQCAKFVARGREWQKRIHSPGERMPNAVVRPLAAGSKVIADDRSATARHLGLYCSDAVAVDMEGHGFLHGAYVNAGVEALVIRGISDMLSGKSSVADLHWQPLAARHAAAFAFELLTQHVPSIRHAAAGNTARPRSRFRRGAWATGLLVATLAAAVSAFAIFRPQFQLTSGSDGSPTPSTSARGSATPTSPSRPFTTTSSTSPTPTPSPTSTEEEKPAPPPVAPPTPKRKTVPLTRYRDSQGTRLSATPSIDIPAGFVSETRLGSLLTTPEANTIKLYACKLTDGDEHRFTSNDQTGACEGQTTIALLGYEFKIAPKEQYVPLFRCYTEAGQHYDSVKIDCDGNYSNASGYLLP